MDIPPSISILNAEKFVKFIEEEIGDGNRSHFSYKILVHDSEWLIHMFIDWRIACEERGYEMWNYVPNTKGLFRCYTTFLG